MKRGRLIALEGIDGCGKSTQARRLAAARGALLTFEPGATPVGQQIRGLLLDPTRPAPEARTEALLMAADRAQHVEQVIAPALAGGRWVVTDRFSGSTLAYQGWGRGLDIPTLHRLVAFAAGGVEADLSILVEVPPAVARHRLGSAAPDRLERLDPGFHGRVADGFAELASSDPRRWVVVDGTAEVDAVASAVAAAVEDRFG